MNKLTIVLIALLTIGQLNAQKMKNTDSKNKVVILLAHPNMQESKANKALINAVKNIPEVEIIDLYANATQPFNAEAHANALASAKALVFQFPFYWASAPSQLKKWLDEVFTPLAGTDIVKGKPLLVTTTTGSEYDSYRSGGRNHFTLDELLRPYQLTANHSGMIWQTPIVIYGTATAEATQNINQGALTYKKKIEQLIEQ